MGWGSKLKKAVKKGVKKVKDIGKKVWEGAKKVFKKITQSKIFWAVVAVAAVYFTYGAYIGATATSTTSLAGASATAAPAAAGTTGGIGAATGGAAASQAVPWAAAGGATEMAPVAAAATQAAPAAATVASGEAAAFGGAAAGAGTTQATGGILSSLASYGAKAIAGIQANPWPALMAMQMGGAAFTAKAEADDAEDAQKRFDENMNIGGIQQPYVAAPRPAPQTPDAGPELAAAPNTSMQSNFSPTPDAGMNRVNSRLNQRMSRGVV